ncbi:hypothetical protein RRG08_041399 [Elysia crispata]|uniref:Uncharacterized protein n=1 Tax=Elysia crispata TaxID=231223 RepID=A0AAE0XRC0_9GAST|nr:hypothetical protein RRG08_041399 [Elysia crispata]
MKLVQIIIIRFPRSRARQFRKLNGFFISSITPRKPLQLLSSHRSYKSGETKYGSDSRQFVAFFRLPLVTGWPGRNPAQVSADPVPT